VILDRLLFNGHLHHGERLLYAVHQHWWAVYTAATKAAFFGILLPILFYLVFPPAQLIFLAWVVLGFLVFLYRIVDWYFDVILITSMGIIGLDWRGIFDKSSHRADFETVAGVIYEKTGFWSTMLNFGPLFVDKEGAEEERIWLSHAADPLEAERQVLLAKEAYSHEHALESEDALKEILSNLVADHVRREKEKKHISDLL